MSSKTDNNFDESYDEYISNMNDKMNDDYGSYSDYLEKDNQSDADDNVTASDVVGDQDSKSESTDESPSSSSESETCDARHGEGSEEISSSDKTESLDGSGHTSELLSDGGSGPSEIKSGGLIENAAGAAKGVTNAAKGMFSGLLGGGISAIKGLFNMFKSKSTTAAQSLGIPIQAFITVIMMVTGVSTASLFAMLSDDNNAYMRSDPGNDCVATEYRWKDNGEYKPVTQDSMDGTAYAVYQMLSADRVEFSPENIAGMLSNAVPESNINPATFEFNHMAGIDNNADAILARTHHRNWDAYCERMFELYEEGGLGINTSAYKYNEIIGTYEEKVNQSGGTIVGTHYYPGVGLWQWTGPRAYALQSFADTLENPSDNNLDGHNDAMYNLDTQISFLLKENVWNGPGYTSLKEWGTQDYTYTPTYKDDIVYPKIKGSVQKAYEKGNPHAYTYTFPTVTTTVKDENGNVVYNLNEDASSTRDPVSSLVRWDADYRYAWIDLQEKVEEAEYDWYKAYMDDVATWERTEQNLEADDYDDGNAHTDQTKHHYDATLRYECNGNGTECGGIHHGPGCITPDKVCRYNGRLIDDCSEDCGCSGHDSEKEYNNAVEGIGIVTSEITIIKTCQSALLQYEKDNNSIEDKAKALGKALNAYYGYVKYDFDTDETPITDLAEEIYADALGWVSLWDENLLYLKEIETNYNSTINAGYTSHTCTIASQICTQEHHEDYWSYTLKSQYFWENHKNTYVGLKAAYDDAVRARNDYAAQVDVMTRYHGKSEAGAKTAKVCAIEFYNHWLGATIAYDEHIAKAEYYYAKMVAINRPAEPDDGTTDNSGTDDTDDGGEETDTSPDSAEEFNLWKTDSDAATSILAMLDKERTNAYLYEMRLTSQAVKCGAQMDNSSIAAAAISWAWPKGYENYYDINDTASMNGQGYIKTRCTSLYIAVKDVVEPGDVTYYSSCCRGASTAVRASGSDDAYPLGGCGVQIDYMDSNPDKWLQVDDKITSTADLDQLQPGDILVYRRSAGEAHIVIFVGGEGGYELVNEKWPGVYTEDECKYAIVHASLSSDYANSRGPRFDPDCSSWLFDYGYMAYRCLTTDAERENSECKRKVDATNFSGYHDGSGPA